jgi:hypothetical protein
MQTRTCNYCGKRYLQLQFSQKFCCRACSDAWYVLERKVAVNFYREIGGVVPSPANEDGERVA